MLYFNGQINKRDYQKALEIRVSYLKWVKWLCGLLLLIVILSYSVTSIRNPALVPSLLPGIIFPLVSLSFPWWMIFIQATSYDQKGNIYRNPVNGQIDEDGVTMIGSGIKSQFCWNVFTSYKLQGSMLLLYQGKSCFNIFTSSLFADEEDWNKFQKIVKEKIQAK
jgi:hypothetical protein